MILKLLPLYFLLACLPLQAQVYTAARASAIVPDAAALRYDGSNSLPKYIALADGEARPMDDAPAYLRTYLRLPENHHFELIASETDRYGIEHRRYRQTVDGHPVLGGVYIFHGHDGYWTEANGELQLPEYQTSALLLSPEEALLKAIQLRPATLYGWETDIPLTDYPEPQLHWAPYELDFRPGNFRLTYEVYLYRAKPHSHERLFIDATTGQLVAVEDQIHYHNTPGQARTRNSGLRPIITTNQGDTTFVLRETTRGKGIFTYNAQNQQAYPYDDFHDDDNFWENVNAQRNEVATDCHWGAEQFYDLLQGLGRNSIDGEGEALESHVHYGQNLANAFWDGRRASFGDGASGFGIDLPSISLDVVAHEFTHGLTNRTSRLIYNNESGGLNESFSDIFGAATNFTFRPEVANWRVGSDVTRNGQGIRSMENPNIFNNPKAYQGQFWVDGGGVHNNSGPSNHWFYLLTEGGSGTNEFGTPYTVQGLGLQDALEIAYRNNAFYLTESSTYADAAFNSLLAAASAFGSCSPTINEVVAAWQAVNITVALPNEAIAAFRVDGPFCNLGDTVRFVNSSLGDAYFWDFGDGNSSSEQAPQHIYNAPGAYTVQLRVEDCSGNSDTLTQTAAVLIDPDNVYCQFDTMPAADTLTIASCRGVLFDSGGPRARYQNSEASMLTIENPDGTPITLQLIRFRTEIFSDRLFVFDGPDGSGQELAVLSGALPARSITSSGPVISLRWSSDGGGTDDGWEIRWGSSTSNRPPDASFTASLDAPAINEPIVFQGTASLPGPLTYDFGDGSPSVFVNGPVSHAFTQAGMYRVTAYDANCSSADTAYLDLLVQEGVSLAVNPSSIIDTMEVGESRSYPIRITNESVRTSYFAAQFPDFSPVQRTSNQTFTLGNRTTNHSFSNLPDLLPNPVLEVYVEGDFGSSGKQASVTVEGELLSVLGGNNNPASRLFTLSPNRAQLATWLADGQIEVVVTSSNTVSTLGFANLHRVSFRYDRIPYLQGPADFPSTLAASSDSDFPLQVATEGLIPGDYQDTLFLISSDADQPRIPVLVQLHLTGRPIAQLSSDSLDFGFLRIGERGQQSLSVTNIGAATLEINSLQFDDPRFSTDFSPLTLAPQDRLLLDIAFLEEDEMALAGAVLAQLEQGLLEINTNAGSLEVVLQATLAVPPVLAVETPERLVVELPAASSKDSSILLRNAAEITPLRLQVSPGVFAAESEQFFTADNNTTIHLFPDLPLNSSPFRLLFVFQGDFSSPAERARYFLNGTDRGLLNNRNLTDNLPDSVFIDVPAEFVQDGQLEVRIENSSAVGFDPAFANRHALRLFQENSVDWLGTPPTPFALGGEEQASVPITFDASSLTAGIYEGFLSILSNDPDQPQQNIPVRMIVTGEPTLAVSTDSLRFGSVQLTSSRQLQLRISNEGADVLRLDNISVDNAQFSLDNSSLEVAPRSFVELPIRFSPLAIGQHTASLLLEGPRVAPQTIFLDGTGLAAAEMDYSPVFIELDLLSSQDTSFRSLVIGSVGSQPLRYQIGESLGNMLVWSYAMNPTSYEQVLAPVFEATPGITASLQATTEADTLRRLLTEAEVLFIPDMVSPDPAVLAAMRLPIAEFMERGGRIILTGGEAGSTPAALGLFSATFVRSNPAAVPIVLSTTSHPLLEGLPDTILSTERTTFLVGGPQQAATTFGRMFGNTCIASFQQQRGEVIYLGFTFEESSENSLQLLRNTLAYAISPSGGAFPSWLNIQPANGILSVGHTADHEVRIDPSGLAEGIYTYSGAVLSNAPNSNQDNSFVIRLNLSIDTRVEDDPSITQLSLYPNPSTGPVYVDLDWSGTERLQAQLFDQQGRQLLARAWPDGQSGGQLILPLASLPAGTYQVVIQTNSGRQIAVRQLVKQ